LATELKLKPGDETSWATRVLWMLVGTALLSWSFELVNSGWNYRWAGAASVLLGGWGLATVAAGWVAPPWLSRELRDALGWATAAVCIVGLLAWTLLTIRAGTGYGTDELAFNQYAAMLVREGSNPYVHSMQPALTMFSVSEHGFTHTLTGHLVTRLSYPALSFLVYVPLLVLGWSNRLGVGADLIGWSLSILMMFAMLPRSLRPAALVLGMAGAFVTLSSIGLTDLTFMPLLLLAAYRWDRFGHGRLSWIGPVALGLAIAAKQTAWPILPFVLIALACDPRNQGRGRALDLRRAGRYLLIVVIAFAAPNLPFIIASPAAWWRGILTPIVTDLVPGGQGAVAIGLLIHLGGGSLTAFSILGALTFIGLLLVYAGTFPLLRAATFLLPSFAYFFEARSYAIYLVALIPPALVAGLTAAPDATPAANWRASFRSRVWLYGSGAIAIVWVAAAIHALAASGPLRMRIVGVDNRPGAGGEQEMTVEVGNRSGSSVRPSFSLQTGSSVTNFWEVLRGPASLAPGQSARYTLVAPDAGAQEPINDQGLRILAFTTDPATISGSQRYLPRLWSLGYVPEYADITARIGQTVIMRTQLVDRSTDPLHIAGVPVKLRQLVSSNSSTTRVDGHDPGVATVAQTNADGTASFRITGVRAGEYPTQYRATLPSGGRWHYKFVPPAPLTIRFTR
jgi:hypothetical protein